MAASSWATSATTCEIDLAGRHVVLEVDAPVRELVVRQCKEVVKRLPLKGLSRTMLAFDDFVDQLRSEARSDWRRTEEALRARRQRRWAGS